MGLVVQYAPPSASGQISDPRGRPESVRAEVLRWANESAVSVLVRFKDSAASTVVWKRAFFSEDAEHGSYVIHSCWSPDGRFFAFQTTSSGGHQPYRSPVTILDVHTRETSDLESKVRTLPQGNCAVTWPGPKQAIRWGQDGRLHFFAYFNEDVREAELKMSEAVEFAYDPVQGSVGKVAGEGTGTGWAK